MPSRGLKFAPCEAFGVGWYRNTTKGLKRLYGLLGALRGIIGRALHTRKTGGIRGGKLAETDIFETRKIRVRFSGDFCPQSIFAGAGARGSLKVVKVVKVVKVANGSESRESCEGFGKL